MKTSRYWQRSGRPHGLLYQHSTGRLFDYLLHLFITPTGLSETIGYQYCK